MKTTGKILASAIAVAVGLSSALANPTTNGWWTVDFGTGYTNGGLITNGTPVNGAWTSTGGDASIMTNATISAYTSNMGKLDTQGGALIWTPTQGSKPVGSTTVLIDTKVYMVGSEDAPAASTGNVQTEVFLTNAVVGAVTTSYLCAHVGDGSGGSNWVQLAGVAVTNETWIDLRIEIDYDQTPPQIAFYVNSIQMSSGDDWWFDVLPSGASQTTVNDVTFMGTGYIDNFIGQGVVTPASGPTFDDGGINTNDAPDSGNAVSIVENAEAKTVTATFATGTKFVQMTGPAGFVRTARVTDGVGTFNTDGLPAGTYTITAFYGDAPSVIPTGYKPAAEAVNGSKAADVIEENDVKKIAINVAPVSGLYYTLFAGPALNSLTAGEASVLATPADQDTGALQIKMPVPTTANEVKIIKIYASDAPYAKDATP